MTTVSITDCSAQPLDYLRRTEAGEEFEIVRDGRPVVRLAPAPEPSEADDVPYRDLLLGMTVPAKLLDIQLPTTPAVVERRMPDINLGWFPPVEYE